MKKALSILAAAMLVPLLSSPAWAEGDEAYSANAVGVVKYVLPAGGELICATLPLIPMDDPRHDGSWVWSETSLCDQLDIGSTVYFWTNAVWQGFTKGATNMINTNGWAPAANKWLVKQGEAFFLRGPKTAEEDKTVSLLGELPTDKKTTYDLTGQRNLDARSATVYPVDVKFSDTGLATQLESGDTIYFWTNAVWQAFARGGTNVINTNGWAPAANKWIVNVGEGMFVKRVGNGMSVTNARPFEWDDSGEE